MALTIYILSWLLRVFSFLLIARIIVEMIQSFSRDWRPTGVLVVIFEFLFTITDPPVKALRRVIPPVRLGAVQLDISVLVLFVIIFFLQMLLGIAMSYVA